MQARALSLVALTGVGAGLIGCAHTDADRPMESRLTEHFNFCLSADRPAYSPGHIDCVLARHESRQRELARLRGAVTPAPQPALSIESQLVPGT